MDKYISVSVPSVQDCGYAWWTPKGALKVISFLEKEQPEYEFVQIVTSPGNGGYKEFAIMKKNK